jgi:hypothetical protein
MFKSKGKDPKRPLPGKVCTSIIDGLKQIYNTKVTGAVHGQCMGSTWAAQGGRTRGAVRVHARGLHPDDRRPQADLKHEGGP